jgi:hypothetical protein
VIATRLVSLLGGAVWPPGAAAPDGGAAPVTGLSAGAGPAAAQPAVDVLTEQTAAVIMDRPVVPMSAWLADALRGAEDGGRALAIVTGSSARLSLPVRSVLSGLPNRWVVRDGDQGYYDGLSGSVLRWENGAFAATGTPAPAFVTATGRALGEDGQQLLLTFRTRDLAEERLRLGGALETAWRRLTGAAPAGWGTAEPACLPWSRDELTRLARTRAPEPTWLTVVGHPDRPAVATLRVSRTTGGVEQECVLALGYPAGHAPDPDALPELAEELVADHALVTLLCQHRAARADLTVPPYLEAAPTPLAFVLGADGLRETGQERAERPPVPVRPRRLGSASAAGYYYPLQHADWDVFQQLMGHLRAAANRGPEQPRPGPD